MRYLLISKTAFMLWNSSPLPLSTKQTKCININIKVVDISGKEASWKQLLVRFLINRPSGELLTRFIGEEGAIISLGLWYIAMGISTVVAEDGRGFPDKMAKTVVVMRDESTSDSNKSTLA